MGTFLVTIFFIIIICFVLYSKNGAQNSRETYMPESINDRPKIGAEVSASFYNEVKEYCSKHSMTISDLIRSSVKNYMDMHQ